MVNPRKLGLNMATIPTIASMKTTGVPAIVRLTKRTPRASSGEAPHLQQGPHHQPDQAADRRPAGQAGQRRAQPGAPLPGHPCGPGQARVQVVQGDEVVAHRHRDDRVEPRDLEGGGDPGRGPLAERELGGAPAPVDQQQAEADPGEGLHRSLPPGRAVVGHQRDDGHRATLDRQRDAHPDHPEEGEARQLVGPEEREAEHLAGEDVAHQRQQRHQRGDDRDHPRDPRHRGDVEADEPLRARERGGQRRVGRRRGGAGVLDDGGHRARVSLAQRTPARLSVREEPGRSASRDCGASRSRCSPRAAAPPPAARRGRP